jgi:hypothetical protein
VTGAVVVVKVYLLGFAFCTVLSWVGLVLNLRFWGRNLLSWDVLRPLLSLPVPALQPKRNAQRAASDFVSYRPQARQELYTKLKGVTVHT